MDPILLIDDDEQLSEVICLLLESEGFRIRACAEPEAAVAILAREEMMAVLLDIHLGEHDGVRLLPRLRELDPDIPIFMITAHGELETAVQSFTLGANGYIRKPFQEGELKGQVLAAVEGYKLKKELRAVRMQAAATVRGDDIRSIFLTRDSLLDPLIREIGIAASVTSNVVIIGETGTGKEVVARALHKTGARRRGPFIAFNCAAVPENLIEAELFGHVRGAFTDARENKPGLFARAHGGTLFLDEIGDAPASVQAKLLRVLQEREVLPIGGSAPIPIDVRVVAATHRRLEDEVASGRFRQDLFYRLHVIPLRVPPLRARKKDILFLASIFASQLSEQMGVRFEGFTPAAANAMESHPWPGNVRELRNRIERAVVLGIGGSDSRSAMIRRAAIFPEARFSNDPHAIDPQDEETCPPGPAQAEDKDLPTFGEAKNTFEKSYLERVLAAARGNITRAAQLASKSRTEVYGLIRKHGIDLGKFKGGRTGGNA